MYCVCPKYIAYLLRFSATSFACFLRPSSLSFRNFAASRIACTGLSICLLTKRPPSAIVFAAVDYVRPRSSYDCSRSYSCSLRCISSICIYSEASVSTILEPSRSFPSRSATWKTNPAGSAYDPLNIDKLRPWSKDKWPCLLWLVDIAPNSSNSSISARGWGTGGATWPLRSSSINYCLLAPVYDSGASDCARLCNILIYYFVFIILPFLVFLN